jgi:effector-binding domain-containing protein
MKVEIIHKNVLFDIYGFSGVALNKDYSGKAFELMNKMWQTVKANELKNKGINIWVYDQENKVFAGTELNELPNQIITLEHKVIQFTKYAYYKHIGSYKLLKQVGQIMQTEIENRGLKTCFPYIEIYGHWNKDETKLETELLMNII